MYKILITTVVRSGSTSGGVFASTVVVELDSEYDVRQALDAINESTHVSYTQTAIQLC